MCYVRNKLLLQLIFVLFTVITARKITNEELHSFPKMFYLDDLERCLANKEGLFCLGTFELTASQPSQIWDLMKLHTNERYSFNRTLLRRGYCLSERCETIREANATLRFQSCVAKHLQRFYLTPHIKRLHYCTTFKQKLEESNHGFNKEQIWFLYAIGGIVMLNLAGTVYHCSKGDNADLNPFLLAWSLPWNWGRFTKVPQGGLLGALAPLQSVRLALQLLVIIAHAVIAHYKVYVQNAEMLEALPAGSVGVLIGNGTAIVQVFILVSCFLTGFNLLYSAQKINITAKILFIWVLKRLTRVFPVYLFVLWFVISLWPYLGDGPIWSSVVTRDSDVCRNKLWTQLLFINNLVSPLDMCLLQTWAIALDMQVYLLSTAITLLLMKLKFRAVPIFMILFVSSVVLNITLAYINGWEPNVRIIRPETLRNLFKDNPAFAGVHISPWASFPACFLGLFMAHYYFENNYRKKTISSKTSNYENRTDLNKAKSDETSRHEEGTNLNKVQDPIGKLNQPIGYANGRTGQTNKKDFEAQDRQTRDRIDENESIRNEFDHEPIQSVQNGIRKRKETVTSLNGYQNGVDAKLKAMTQDDESNNMNELDGEVANGLKTKNGMTSITQKFVFQLFGYSHIFIIPALLLWPFAGAPVINAQSPVTTALYVGMERAVFTMLFGVLLTHLFTVDSWLRRVATWHGWHAFGRLAYSALLLHWCVNASIVAARTEAITTSLFYMMVDALATIFFTYLLALPVHLLIELPSQKFLDLLISVPSSIAQFRQ